MTEFHGLGQLPFIPDNLTIPQFFLETLHSSRSEDAPFFIEDATARRIGHSEVVHRTNNLARGLKAQYDISDPDVVCLFSSNHVDYAVTVWAVHSLGAIVSPSNPGYTEEELVHQLRMTKARLVVTFSDFFPTALAAARIVGMPEKNIVLIDAESTSSQQETIEQLIRLGSRSEDFAPLCLMEGEAKTRIAFLSFSSGTTGKAKAVKIPHYAVIANVLQMSAHWSDKRVHPGTVSAAVLPLFHIYGLVVTLHYMLFSGASLVVIPKFSFVDYLKSIVRHKITHLFVVPPQVVLLTKHPATKQFDLSHVRFVMSGAAPLSGELLNQLLKLVPNAEIGQGYGLTETSTTISCFPIHQKIGTVGSAGTLIPGIKARIVKTDGSLAKEGEQGELVVSGPSMALGYLNNDEATQETFQNGWVRTGDEVIIRNNDLFIVDRLKEIIKVKGFQVAPAELEGHLLLHSSVLDSCVVGVPDEYSGEVPFAFIVVEPSLKAKLTTLDGASHLKNILAKHVSDNKINYKWLRGGIEFVDSIPKNPTGKILRRLLRGRAYELRASSLAECRVKL